MLTRSLRIDGLAVTNRFGWNDISGRLDGLEGIVPRIGVSSESFSRLICGVSRGISGPESVWVNWVFRRRTAIHAVEKSDATNNPDQVEQGLMVPGWETSLSSGVGDVKIQAMEDEI